MGECRKDYDIDERGCPRSGSFNFNGLQSGPDCQKLECDSCRAVITVRVIRKVIDCRRSDV